MSPKQAHFVKNVSLDIIKVMHIIMENSHPFSIPQLKEFLKGSKHIQFKGVNRKEKYNWIEQMLTGFNYFRLRKKDKMIVKEYLMKITGFSDSQMTRLIYKKKKFGKILASSSKKNKFPQKYTSQDIDLLLETDNNHERLSGKSTKEILEREYKIFKKLEYENIKEISVSHIYNLRGTRRYKSNSLTFKKTFPVNRNIGERKKPDNQGEPGYLRVDTVHQGDKDYEKGVYHINVIDEITQWEIVACVEQISEYYLMPILEDLIIQFPYKIINFHSDNGSEYINEKVAGLLRKLLIHQTKSRPRRTNDNALVEGKNGSIIRKHMGRNYISKSHAQRINDFYKQYFNDYLNYHRPCGFPSEKIDRKGKIKKQYLQKNYQTPYEKLKSLDDACRLLKKDISFEMLDKIAYAESDNEFACKMKKEKVKLFSSISKCANSRKNINS